MEKLELKHLAPYLPYELKCHLQGENMHDCPVLFEIQSLSIHGADCHEVNGVYILETFFEDIFPILRPLSDLTKEIEHNVEKFYPYEKLRLNYSDVTNFLNEDLLISQWWNYETVTKLLEWHFDIFGLIGKGLAIDINTVNK